MARRKKKGVSAKKGENKENQPPESQHKASNRPTKLRIWSNQSMLQAMETVKSGYMGMNRAAIEYGVPRTSLKDRLSGRVIHGTNNNIWTPRPITLPRSRCACGVIILPSLFGRDPLPIRSAGE